MSRPLANQSVKQIDSFEIFSSIEWRYPLSFSPDVSFDIEQSLADKLRAMQCYQSELCDFPHPRSFEDIELNVKYHRMRVGLKYAEAFKPIRFIRKNLG